MKKYILITVFLIIFFILFNFFNIKNTIYIKIGNYYYHIKGKENISIKYFNKANNIESIYNTANTFYKLKEYNKAIEIYNNILEIYAKNLNLDINLKCNIFYNLGNSYFKIGIKNKTSLTEKISFLEKALIFYRKSVNISSVEKAEKTNKNIEFTEFILKNLKKDNPKINNNLNYNKKQSSLKEDKKKELLKKNIKNKKETKKNNQEKIYSKKNELKGSKKLNSKLSKESLKAIEEKIKNLELNQSKYKKVYNKKYYNSDNKNQKNKINW